MRCRCAAKSLGKLVLCPIHTARLDRLVALRRAAQIESAMREFWTLPTARTICHLPDYPYWQHKRRNHTPQNSNKSVLSLVTRLPGPRSAANQPRTPQPLSIDGTDRRTDRRTDIRPLHRPCSANSARSVDENRRTCRTQFKSQRDHGKKQLAKMKCRR